MAIINTVPQSEATGIVARVYAQDLDDLGYVASHTKAMTMNPEAYEGWEQLVGAISRSMGKRRYELVTLAAAFGVGSQHCRLAHGRKSLPLFDEQQLIRIAHDYHDAGLSESEVAMMEFAERVSRDSAQMTDADSQRLRDVGFSDREIVDIALAAAARNFYSRAIQALAVAVDVPPGLNTPLRDALVEGI